MSLLDQTHVRRMMAYANKVIRENLRPFTSTHTPEDMARECANANAIVDPIRESLIRQGVTLGISQVRVEGDHLALTYTLPPVPEGAKPLEVNLALFSALVASTDPIHEHEGKWWFWDETWSDRHGPYDSKERAEVSFKVYVETFLDPPPDEAFQRLRLQVVEMIRGGLSMRPLPPLVSDQMSLVKSIAVAALLVSGKAHVTYRTDDAGSSLLLTLKTGQVMKIRLADVLPHRSSPLLLNHV